MSSAQSTVRAYSINTTSLEKQHFCPTWFFGAFKRRVVVIINNINHFNNHNKCMNWFISAERRETSQQVKLINFRYKHTEDVLLCFIYADISLECTEALKRSSELSEEQ